MTETVKISNLPNAGVLDGTERVPIVAGGVTCITTTQQIGNLFNGPGAGTVTSVGMSAPGIFFVSGSPVTTSGTLGLSLVSQSANQVWAGPSSGGAAAPSFRSLVSADLPSTPEFTAINLGAPSDTTLTRVSAGRMAVEGSNVLMASDIGVTVQGYATDSANSNVVLGIEDIYPSNWLYSVFPASAPYANAIIGAGAQSTGTVYRATVVGALAATNMVNGHRYEAVGQGSLRWTKYTERTTCVGTLTGQWGGATLTDDPLSHWYDHDIIYNLGVTVFDPLWDLEGLETRNPGIRATIASWVLTNPWATGTTDFMRNAFFGRDAGVEIITGTNNANLGYRAGAFGLEVSYNTCVGSEAGHDNLYGDGNTSAGYESNRYNQTGSNNTAVGRAALHDFIDSSRNTGLGYSAGLGCYGGDNNIYIGPFAGNQDAGGGHSQRFYLQASSTVPFMIGDLSTGRLAVGLGVTFADLSSGTEGILIRQTAAVGGVAPNTSARGLVIEESGASTGMTIKTQNTHTGQVIFADEDDNNPGGMVYVHSTDTMQWKSGDVTRLELATALQPATSDGLALGTTSKMWSDAFFANGAVVNFNNGNLTMTHSAGAMAATGVWTLASATATPAGGSTSARLLFGTTAGFGIYYGSGAPSVSAGQGSLYLRSDGSSTSTRLYVNTDGSTGWTSFTSAT